MQNSLAKLYKAIGYEFSRPELMTQALTHRSAKGEHNERLEFLGDSVLNHVIADALYHKFPKSSEGDLSRMRASLVCGPTLAEIGREFHLGDHLKLGPGELKSGGFRRESILEDAVEAIIGAVYLEAGLEATRELIMRWFDTRLASIQPGVHQKDPKTRLQEWLQARRHALPKYNVDEIRGKAHQQTFVVSCEVADLSLASKAEATSRRKAEQAAAEQILEQINVK